MQWQWYNNFKIGFKNILEEISPGGNELLLLGDFNLDMLPRKLSVEVRYLRQLFNIYQVTQLIKSPTRVPNNSSTLIYLALITDEGKIAASRVMQCSINDHSLLYLVRRARKVQNTFKNIQFQIIYYSKIFKNIQKLFISVSQSQINYWRTLDSRKLIDLPTTNSHFAQSRPIID